jgi:hypothetical protein
VTATSPAPPAAGWALARPSPEELAAIVAAVELVWPRPVVVAPAGPDDRAWRFSGRWWARPVSLRRERPWVG